MTAYRFIGLSAPAAALAAALASTPTHAADYYAAKTIELVVGGDAGGGASPRGRAARWRTVDADRRRYNQVHRRRYSGFCRRR